jgi:hypothetical protein
MQGPRCGFPVPDGRPVVALHKQFLQNYGFFSDFNINFFSARGILQPASVISTSTY